MAKKQLSESWPPTHTDSLLREHQMLLKVSRNKVALVDWSEKLPSTRRVQAYLKDLKRHPGYPGEMVAAQLQKQVDAGAYKAGIGVRASLREVERMLARERKLESGRINRITKDWKAATEKFCKSPAGADWPGGEENLKILGKILEANNLADQPSVENITRAYRLMKRRGLLVR